MSPAPQRARDRTTVNQHRFACPQRHPGLNASSRGYRGAPPNPPLDLHCLACSQPGALNPKHQTTNPKISSLDAVEAHRHAHCLTCSQPGALNPKPHTPNPKLYSHRIPRQPGSLNPKPQALDPKPSTTNPYDSRASLGPALPNPKSQPLSSTNP
ncbi:hypothetical protein T484DRAFT_2498670 [Baffinella frigidus]|nr:hypothetical protein T484DRAFT_2498670 [Cryptophyta sp. CCMP2293]